MRSAASRFVGEAGSSRTARAILLAYLAFAVISRTADANEHPDRWFTIFVVACFVLPTWYALGWRPAVWDRFPLLMLGVQAVVTFVPLFVFGQQWVGGVDGLLAGLALAVLARPLSWVIFGALIAIELAAWMWVGIPSEPWLSTAIWLVVAYVNVALGYYGMSTSVRLLERIEATAEVLADAAVDRERLATAAGLQATIMRRLDDVQRYAVAALAARSIRATETSLGLVGDAARNAASSARRIVSAIPEPATPAFDDTAATPALARRVVRGVALVFAVVYVSNIVSPMPGVAEPTALTTSVAIAIAIVMVGLQLRHSGVRPGGRPRNWAWSLGLQAVLCFALYPVFGVVSVGFIPFVGGSILLLIRHPVRWALAGGLIAVIPILMVVRPSGLGALQIQWAIYAGATWAAATLVFYGLGRFVRSAQALRESQAQLAATAVTRERVRIARDTHDTLGLALSAIALKSDLAQALLNRDPARARREIVQTVHLSRTVAADADSIVNGNLRLYLDAELQSARSVLDAAGIAATIEQDRVPLSADAETELAAILREAVANVLRHSDATACSIRITAVSKKLTVSIANDGAHTAGTGPAGRGLDNIRDRAAALGGTTNASVEDGTFTLVVELPRAALAPYDSASTPVATP